MKTLFLIFNLSFLIWAHAQQEELINTTWYLEKVIIDDTEYFQPFNWESTTTIPATFENGFFESNSICNTIQTDEFTEITENSFSYTTLTQTFNECIVGENYDFEEYYINVFVNYETVTVYSPMNYTIESVDDYFQLTLTNTEGNQAIYNSVNLSVEDIGELDNRVRIFPNPVQDILYVDREEYTGTLMVAITHLDGQLILQQKLSTPAEINISTLEKGVYICTVYDENNKVIQSEKIIKE